ncbi:MAG: hypothetical protein R6V04_14645 [bacterium]
MNLPVSQCLDNNVRIFSLKINSNNIGKNGSSGLSGKAGRKIIIVPQRSPFDELRMTVFSNTTSMEGP